MKEMPVDYFGYYTMLEPFAAGYYAVGEEAKGRALITKLAGKYQESLNFYAGLPSSSQNAIAITIMTDIERYRSLLLVIQDQDPSFYKTEKVRFNQMNERFKRFGRKNE